MPSDTFLPIPLSIFYPITFPKRHYGPQTSNANFCEVDHQFSSYVAELINTLTNLIYLVYAVHGLRTLRARGTLTVRSALPFVGLALVGISSASFHATLLKWPQLADDVSMALPTGAIVCRLVSFDVSRDKGVRDLVYWGVAGIIAGVYVLHVVLFVDWIHYCFFGVMIVYVGRRCVELMGRVLRDGEVREMVRWRARQGEVLFVGAFGLWLVDVFFCGELMVMREWLGLPWGWLLELHGWWHVGTGMGAYVFMQIAEFLVESYEKGDGGVDLDFESRLNPFSLRLPAPRPHLHAEKVSGLERRNKRAGKML